MGNGPHCYLRWRRTRVKASRLNADDVVAALNGDLLASLRGERSRMQVSGMNDRTAEQSTAFGKQRMSNK